MRADVYRQIGDSYRTQELYADAERNLRKALSLRLELYGEDNAKVAESMYILSGVRLKQGDLAENERLLTKVLSIQRRHPNDGNNLPYMIVDYASILSEDKNDYRGALPLDLEALEMSRQRYGDNHYMVAATHERVSTMYRSLGDYAQVEAHLQEALKHPPVGLYSDLLVELAGVQTVEGNYQSAKTSIEQASPNKAMKSHPQSFQIMFTARSHSSPIVKAITRKPELMPKKSPSRRGRRSPSQSDILSVSKPQQTRRGEARRISLA